jgi:DNA-binding GntR family transcriptional regulator
VVRRGSGSNGEEPALRTEHDEALAPLRGFKSKVDLVYDYMRGLIVSRDLLPDKPINVDALARQLGVSIIPIREALRRLESQGLVVQRPHAGATVAPLDPHQRVGVHLAREVLERLTAEGAAEIITDEELAQLDRLQATMRELVELRDFDRLRAVNMEFHVAIAATTGYRIIIDFIEQLQIHMARHQAPNHAEWRAAVEEHQYIIEALRRHDKAAAGDAAASHATRMPTQADHYAY